MGEVYEMLPDGFRQIAIHDADSHLRVAAERCLDGLDGASLTDVLARARGSRYEDRFLQSDAAMIVLEAA